MSTSLPLSTIICREVKWTTADISSVYNQLRNEMEEKEHVQLQSYLSVYCDNVLHNATKKRKRCNTERLLESTTCRTTAPCPTVDEHIPDQTISNTNSTYTHCYHNKSRKQFKVVYKSMDNHTSTIQRSDVVEIIPIIPTYDNQSLPSYTFCVPITKPILFDDEPELSYVPLLDNNNNNTNNDNNDDDHDTPLNTIYSMYQTTKRENLLLFGSICYQQQINDMMDQLFYILFHHHDDIHNGIIVVPPISHHIWNIIATITKQSLVRIRRRLQDWMVSTDTTRSSNEVVSLSQSTSTSTTSSSHIEYSVNSPQTNTTKIKNKKKRKNTNVIRWEQQYEKLTDSYRKLWCRQCYIYDCNVHGLANKSSIHAQIGWSKSKQRDNVWKHDEMMNHYNHHHHHTMNCTIPQYHIPIRNHDDDDDNHTSIQGYQELLLKILYNIFDGNVDHIACVLNIPVTLVNNYIEQQQQQHNDLECSISLSHVHRKKGVNNYYSIKNYKIDWYMKYRDANIFSYYYPCLHDKPCSDNGDCSCIENQFFCTMACGSSIYSPNFFRGCDCKGPCSTGCTCYLAKRECDPNLCVCSCCTESLYHLTTNQRCQNDKMTMYRNPILLIGISDISGWGVYNRHALRSGDYIGSYIGAMMSQEESERRGSIADARGCSYLFLLSSDHSIDASQYGNKLRFLNHSNIPNVEPRTMFVQGQQQVGFYTICNIPEQTELVFDYNYKSICNDRLSSQTSIDHAPWFQKTNNTKPTIDKNCTMK